MSRRRLSEEERALWNGVARSVAPLRRRKAAAAVSDDTASAQAPASEESSKPPSAARRKAVSAPVPIPPPAPRPVVPKPVPLGRRARKKIASGARGIDGRLDLHGMIQDEAYAALLGFLRARQAGGARLVLVITGKGGGGVGAGESRGVLRRMVPLWLELAEFRALVVGFESAAAGHGGGGALYVSLRRAR